jgi:malate/lactate dehydrogenase
MRFNSQLKLEISILTGLYYIGEYTFDCRKWSLTQICRSVPSISTLTTGEYGVQDICLSLPGVVGMNCVGEILALTMNAEEEKGFRSSDSKIKTTLESLQQR